METTALCSEEQIEVGNAQMIELGELANRVRWRRYILSRAASNPYLERPSYAA